MTGAEAIAELQQGLGFRSDKAPELVARLNQAQLKLETGPGDLPWFLLTEDAPILLLPGATTIPLPSGFIRIKEGEGPHFVSEQGAHFLTEADYSQLLSLYPPPYEGVRSGPRAYAIREEEIAFFPPADNPGAGGPIPLLTWSYYHHDTMIANSPSTNGWLRYFPYVVIGEAGVAAARLFRDKDAERIFSTMLTEWKPRLFAEIERRFGSNRDYYMGDEA